MVQVPILLSGAAFFIASAAEVAVYAAAAAYVGKHSSTHHKQHK